PSPSDHLREKIRKLSTLRRVLPAECRPARFSAIPPPAPCCSPHLPVSLCGVAILLAAKTPPRYRLCSTRASAPRLCNHHCCRRPSRDTPHLRHDQDSFACCW